MAKPTDDTGWQAPQIVTTPQGPAGVIQMATMTEATPCYLCKHWHKDTRKLAQYARVKGLVVDEQGCWQMPPSPELQGRSIKIDPKSWGFCLTLGIPTHMNAGAQCEYWRQRETRSDMKGIIG